MQSLIQEEIIKRFHYCDTVERACECGSGEPRIYRCMDCLLNATWCKVCIVEKHRNEPLHTIERWSAKHFVRDSLYQLGLIYCMGHGGDRCTNASSETSTSKIRVTDINGTHMLRVMYCHCRNMKSHFLQLLEGGIFASSVKFPTAGFTIRSLQDFHLIALASKKSAFNYAKVLCEKTSELPFEVHVSLRSSTFCFLLSTLQDLTNRFSRIARYWRYLRAERESGQTVGIDKHLAIRPSGSFADVCLACPIPGINVSTDGQETLPL